MPIIRINTCNSCPNADHNGRLQSIENIYIVCDKYERKKIGRLYGKDRDDIIEYEPPLWCPLEKG